MCVLSFATLLVIMSPWSTCYVSKYKLLLLLLALPDGGNSYSKTTVKVLTHMHAPAQMHAPLVRTMQTHFFMHTVRQHSSTSKAHRSDQIANCALNMIIQPNNVPLVGFILYPCHSRQHHQRMQGHAEDPSARLLLQDSINAGMCTVSNVRSGQKGDKQGTDQGQGTQNGFGVRPTQPGHEHQQQRQQHGDRLQPHHLRMVHACLLSSIMPCYL